MIGSLGYMVIKSGYDSESKVHFIKSPTLIIHGKKDELIHYNHSITIFGMPLNN
jgi:dipeptidyl aminopeptidase/acylaminoacyl peptidase